MHSENGSMDIIDPSSLTIQQLLREINSLRLLLEAQIDAVSKSSIARFDAMDKAMVVFTDNLTRVPTAVDRAVGGLQDKITEKFTNVDNQIRHLNELREEKMRAVGIQISDRDTALAAALQSAKELVAQQSSSAALAISKSETSVTESLKQLHVILNTVQSGIESKISDLKDRVTTIEQRRTGQVVEQVSRQNSQTLWLGIVGGAVGIIGLGLAIFLAASHNDSAPLIVQRNNPAPQTYGLQPN